MSRKKAGESSSLALAIYQEITELTSELIGVGLVDAQNYASIDTGPNGLWQVGQSGAKLHLSLKSSPYEEIYLSLIGAESYNLLFLDGAMMQLSYEGSGETLIRHRLAYFPSPSLRPFQDDPDLYFMEQHFVEIVGHQVVPVPVRFDFDNREGVPVDTIHPVSHVTLGQYQHCRIPATHPVSPRIFVEFILGSFYSTPSMNRIILKKYVSGWGATITERERNGVHFSIGVK
ncbi:DUF2290 domain-containing protein [Rhodococcus sp. Q1]|uniref:DUF2290 domain-containing protein n=1 Tax=Rhodococcus sp. Q1 TaxID=2508718 RepID=UPI0013EBDF3D|nr:DUF2290 domain-containing protein [Rhodococcus sp. Q1]